MKIVVSDSSVLIDLERAVLLETTFRLPQVFAVPDLLYERELRPYNGSDLCSLGLRIMTLAPTGVSLAGRYRLQQRGITLPDAFALALAKLGQHRLLSGDGGLRTLATQEGIECRGVLWVFDQIEAAKLLGPADLASRLSGLAADPRCRLPRAEIVKRLARYRSAATCEYP